LFKDYRDLPLKDRYPTNGGSRKGLPRRLAQAAAKRDLRKFNALYVAGRRKGFQTRRFKVSNAQFAVAAEGLYDRKIEFIAVGNVYYTRPKELAWLLKAAEKAGIRLRSFHDQQEHKPANR
jgi:hypothetical protein